MFKFLDKLLQPKFLTKEQIVDKILKQMSSVDRAYLKSLPRENMGLFHFTIGMNIRNEFKLWDKKNPLTAQWVPEIVDGCDCSPFHPDAVSMNILYTIWDKVNEKD